MFDRRSFPHFVPFLGLLLTAAVTCSNARATQVCVNSVNALNAALIQASVINQPYTIKVVQGTYAMTSDLEFAFKAPFTMEGGYSQNCASRAVDPANTVLDIGYGHSFSWNQPSGSPMAQLNVEGVTFQHSSLGVSLGSGYINQTDGGVNIRQVRFTNISGDTAPAVAIAAISGPMLLENILIDHVATSDQCSVLLTAYQHASVYVNHMTADVTGNNDFCLLDFGYAATFSVYNSVLWSSDAASGMPVFNAALFSQSSVKLVNDVFLGLDTPALETVQNQINADPKWVNPAAGNYRLQNASPAINSGTLFTSVGEPATDIEGHARINGSAPDRGAYESVVTDQSTLIVSKTDDSGPGTLRDAILIANGNSSHKLIKFDISIGNVPLCPAVIALNSALPKITGSVTIDGYTQSGSTLNTSPGAFNANLCVIVKAASGALPYGFWVPANSAGSVVLRGLAVGGFSQPVHILSGQGSQIIGNQFGGTSHGVDLPGAGLSAIVFGAGATGSMLVGGSALGDRNVIGGASGSGIDSQVDATWSETKCQILNNLIGFAPDGVAALPNNFGINVTGSGCQIVGNRIAGNTITNLWLQGGFNVVQQNLVGFNVQDSGFLNNATGILVTGSGNMIGADAEGGSFSANTVRFNVAGGVVVKGDGALVNAINANRIYGNGSGGDGMDIDLWPTNGVAGPTPNDSGDADAGPNGLQNFPVPTRLVYTAAGSTDRPAMLTATLDTLPDIYRVDVYFSNYANASSKRGHAEVILTHTTVLVPASGKLSFTTPIAVPNQNAGGVISMTATNSAGNTSEISTALSTDTIFADGLD